MRILFAATHFGFLRNFESTLRLLAERGHTIHLAADRRDNIDGGRMVENLLKEYPSISAELVPFSKQGFWYAFANSIRGFLDYTRYLAPEYRNAAKLRARAEGQVTPLLRRVSRVLPLGQPSGVRLVQRTLRGVERAIPVRPEVAALLDRFRPDLLLVTPLLYFGSQQIDYVRHARRRGVKSVLCVGSWDHLTTKGSIHEVPDRVVVWNEAQRDEAVSLHGVAADRVIVTGAQPYDRWFETQPSVSRDAFCTRVGLSPAHRIVLYVCSSPFIAPYEVGFVRKWIQAIHAHPALRNAGLLVRPHPQNAEQWQDVDLEFSNVVLWPRGGANPIDADARAGYYDSMYHSHAVVGVNTSALIESAILGKPVYSVLADEFAETQDGTLHFRHLKNLNSGLLRLARTLDEHAAQLAESLAEHTAEDDKARRFVEAFLRPHGVGVAATPRLVDAIETFAASDAIPIGGVSLTVLLVRGCVWPIALLTMVARMERDRLRSLLLHWTRPPRHAVRALIANLIAARRWIMRLVGFGRRVARACVRRLALSPARWALRRLRVAYHTIAAAIRLID